MAPTMNGNGLTVRSSRQGRMDGLPLDMPSPKCVVTLVLSLVPMVQSNSVPVSRNVLSSLFRFLDRMFRSDSEEWR